MNDYLFLMHDDVPGSSAVDDEAWGRYFSKLRAAGAFQGGSSIGGGLCVRKSGPVPGITGHLNGYLKVVATSLAEAQALLEGHPVFDAGGTVEIRELPKD